MIFVGNKECFQINMGIKIVDLCSMKKAIRRMFCLLLFIITLFILSHSSKNTSETI